MPPPGQPAGAFAEGYTVRAPEAADSPRLVAFNLESEALLSPMNEARLAHLLLGAAWARVVVHRDVAVAFLLAFREAADYDSPNFLWFQNRHARFLYIDRVMVSAAHRNRHLGTFLYHELFAFAARTGVPRLTAEYNVQPPNEASRRFHAKFGFREVGTQWIDGGRKQVSLQEALLPAGASAATPSGRGA